MRSLLLLLAGALLSLNVLAQAGPIPAPKVVQVTPRIHALLGPTELPNVKNQGYMVNSVLLVGDTGAIVVDTGFTDEIGALLARTVAGITDKPVTHVINTHHHGDHSLGNAAFPQARFVSSEDCRMLLEKTGPEWIALIEGILGRKLPNTRLVPATQTYARDSKTEITLNGLRLVLWVPKAAHTQGDLMIWLPDEGVLLSGDVIVNQTLPNFRDAHLKEWINTLAEVQTLPIRAIVPGHGPVMTKADAAAMHARMSQLYAGIEAGVKAGLTDSEVRQKLDLSAWKTLKHFDEQMGGNINKAYLEIEADSF